MDILSGGAHTGLTVASSDAIALSSSSPRTASPSQKGTPMPTWFPSIPHATWKQATASFAATKATESEGRSNGIDDEDDDRNSSQYSNNASSVRRGTRDAASERFAQQAKQMEEMRRELEQLKKREATAKEESRLAKEKTSHQDPIDSLRLQPMSDDYAKDVNAVLDQLLKPPPTRRPPPVEKELTARPTSVGFVPQSVSPIADDRHNFPSLPRNDVDPLWFRYGVHSDSKIKPFHRQYDQHDLGAAAMAVQHGPFGRQSSTIAREEGINAMDDAALASSVSDKQFSEAVRNHYPTAIETRQTSFNPSDSLTSAPATQLRPSTSPAVMNTKDTKSKPVHRVTHVPPNTLLSGSPSLHQEEPTTPLFLKQDAFPNSTAT
ncbi:hypothetical protein AGDE_14532 [Angomonas deanei]|uniref:Uncharacterized protein n=1 Tax=Angomonas deanei TaxID=59799 RepID=A0A7G2CBM3_9TRYP|nr:hypothetical protein AGDE_14532 [Angomonas deanei]CAD2215442.1 hypothetical protein, conserved [Angomonas deanei]|eukprot:EPY20719.1 hypothetical protein AGDE_14532 [Angomonas deanei]